MLPRRKCLEFEQERYTGLRVLVRRESLDGRSCGHEEANRIGLVASSGIIFPTEWVVGILNIKTGDVRRSANPGGLTDK
jgi:hypothetical protein